MKNISYFLTLALFCISNLCIAQVYEKEPVDGGGKPTPNRDRNVIWVHGMEGTKTSWQQNYNYFPTVKKINNVVVEYQSSGGTITASYQVRDQVDAQLGADRFNPKNMAICHSMGGLTIRQMEKYDKQYNQNRIGGFITVGSCHQGTQVANSQADGKLREFIMTGSADLLAGPSTAVAIAEVVVPIVLNKPITSLSTWIGDMVYNKLQAFGQGGAIDDLKIGNPNLNALNAYTCTKPMIAIAGAEDAPTLWREIASIQKAPSTDLRRNEIDDAKVADMASMGSRIYDGFYWTNRVASWIPYVRSSTNYRVNKANNWLRGKVWMERANGVWAGLAGAVFSTRTITYPFLATRCLYDDKWNLGCIGKVEDRNFQDNIPAAYDGIVPMNSAIGLPGALLTKTIQGVNHQECVNHPAINSELESILSNPTTAGTTFFYTPPR
jgi:hypothetical protein